MNEPSILLDHGSGGKASQELIANLFLEHFSGQESEQLEDCAVLEFPPGKLAVSTDTFVVTPLFFPGGDIGELAVNGTVNDLAMRGAEPLYLSAAFILEEGLAWGTLERVVKSMAAAAEAAGVRVVTGDTKVVPQGAADLMFINTTGIGRVSPGVAISAVGARPGDKVLISGSIGDHGLAVMCCREGLTMDTEIISDTACLAGLVKDMVKAAGGDVHVLRDPTRGGLGTTLNEIGQSSGVGLVIDEAAVPVKPDVRGACDILGLDPLFVANEGKLIAVVASEAAGRVLDLMRASHLGREAALIGEVVADHPGRVIMQTSIGGRRVVDMPVGLQLPRIC